MEHLQGLIDTKTKVVTVTAAANMHGTKSPLKEIGKMAKEVNAYFVVNAVHHIAHGNGRPSNGLRLSCVIRIQVLQLS